MTVIIHTIGLEGCGHHGLEKIITEILKYNKNYVKKDILNNIILQKSRNCDHPIIFKKYLFPYLSNKNYLIYTDDSYPSGDNRSVFTQKNIIKIYKNLSMFGEIKFIYLKRNIYNTINSHPNFDGNIINHTKVIKDIKIYIENQIKILRDNNINVVELNYEDIDNEIGIEIISKFLNININFVRDTVNKYFKKSTKDYTKILDNETIQIIDNILNN